MKYRWPIASIRKTLLKAPKVRIVALAISWLNLPPKPIMNPTSLTTREQQYSGLHKVDLSRRASFGYLPTKSI